MKTILLLDDNETLRESIAGNITTYRVIPIGDKEAGIKIIEEETIDFIAVDWDLGGEETGDLLYDMLFPHGKSIPGILFTSKDLSSKSIVSLKSKGFSGVISKIHPDVEVSSLIEQEATTILGDCKKRAFHVKQKVSFIGNGNMVIKFQNVGKTIEEWVEEMENWKMQERDEVVLKELIIKHCLASRIRHDDYRFEQL